MDRIVERFKKYIAIDTKSDEIVVPVLVLQVNWS